MRFLDSIRAHLRQWLGIVYLDKHLSGRMRLLEAWRDSCIVAVPVDKHFQGKDIIILAGRFGSEDRVQILAVEFRDIHDMVTLAKRLKGQFGPQPRFFWDGPPGYTQCMREAVERGSR